MAPCPVDVAVRYRPDLVHVPYHDGRAAEKSCSRPSGACAGAARPPSSRSCACGLCPRTVRILVDHVPRDGPKHETSHATRLCLYAFYFGCINILHLNRHA
eukprot:6204517-Prymnesium_polylepis.4